MTSTLYAESEGHRYLDRIPDDPHHMAVVDAVLRAAGIGSGDRVVEIGAGRGRYTALLVSRGLEVVAIEPDAALASALRRRFEGGGSVRVIEALFDDAAIDSSDPFGAVIGFHVLHHLDPATLACLDRLLKARPSVGAAFLEPNPLNPLYPVQIALHPAMRFREERGLGADRWRRIGMPPHCGWSAISGCCRRRSRGGWAGCLVGRWPRFASLHGPPTG